MMESDAKRIKSDNNLIGINILFINKGINSRRLKVMENCAKTNGLIVHQSFSDCVDYIISDVSYEEQVYDLIGINLNDMKTVIVNTKWFTDSIQSKKLMSLNRSYCLKRKKIEASTHSTTEEKFANYICQRKTPLKHYNKKLTDALELLGFEAELKNTMFDEVKCLAYRKASAALKCLPFTVKNIDEVSDLKDIGKHSKKVIMEILDEGNSSEVQQIESSVWFQTMKLFTNVYGIGPKTAKQWYDIGLRSIEDVINSKNALKSESKRVLHGLAFYDDLTEPMAKSEADLILNIIRREIEIKFPSDHTKIETYLTGGFSRGKEFGHDIDILITHKDEGNEKGLLSLLYKHLKDKDFILLGNFHKNNDNESDAKRRTNTLDNLDKVFTIFKLPLKGINSDLKTPKFDSESTKAFFEFANSDRKMEWKARRVDLIVCSISELPFAIIGWVGNEIFCRSLREYARKEMNMKLSNNSLHHLNKGSNLLARNEIEVFELLKLPFIEHSFRNP